MPRTTLFRFNPEKALNAILWIARRVPDPTFHRISKLMYFADKAHLERYGRLICGDTYVAMKHGPVPSEVYDMLKAVRGDGWSGYEVEARAAFEVRGNKHVTPMREADRDLFSDSDLECLDWAIEAYGKMSFQELTVLSHQELPWQQADENDVIDVEQIIATLPDGDALLAYLRGESPAPTS